MVQSGVVVTASGRAQVEHVAGATVAPGDVVSRLVQSGLVHGRSTSELALLRHASRVSCPHATHTGR